MYYNVHPLLFGGEKLIQRIKLVVMFILLAICIWTGRDIFNYVMDGYRAQHIKKELQHIYEATKNEQAAHVKQTDDKNKLAANLEKLKEVNNNIQGWIHIEGTEIDYPILQGNDNDYYLTHDIYHRDSNRGAIFLDYRYNIDAEQIVIYGHHMKDHTMFGSLKNYVDYDFYNQNKFIDVQLGDEIIKWEICSVYVYQSHDNFFKYSFDNIDDKHAYYKLITEKGIYKTNAIIQSNEQLLTLVTCYYTSDDARLIIHAKPVL